MGSDLTNVVVIEYDKNIMISLFTKANQFLNPTSSNNNSQVVDFVVYFDAHMLIEESIEDLIFLNY
jgi:hypothetical protein